MPLTDQDLFTFSCVTDSASRIQLQAWYWVTSLLEIAGVPPSRIFVNAVSDLHPGLSAWLAEIGVTVQRVAPFGHVYCNKLQQLELLADAPTPYVVMMDCDTAVSSAAAWPQPKTIAAKLVDTARPPESVLRRLFADAGLGEPVWADSDLHPGLEGTRTDRNNCNGGVYVVQREFIGTLAPVWRRWAAWCLEREAIFGRDFPHVDQVALTLALRELGVAVEPLPRAFNLPTHLPIPPEADCHAVVLHYHSQLDDQLFLKPVGLPLADAAIARVNAGLAAARGRIFFNGLFFGVRQELYPELGCGIGSRGESLAVKQRILEALLTDPAQSVLDVGCGDLATSGVLPHPRFTGVDIASPVLEKARARRPQASCFAGDAISLPLEPADAVICFDVLIHQPTRQQYLALVSRLAALAQDTLIVGAYDYEPVHTSSITYYYEPITRTLADTGAFAEISVAGKYRDITVVVARKFGSTGHSRDLLSVDFNAMAAVTDHPLGLRLSVDLARARLGFFPAHTPRALEYPWILAQAPAALQGKRVLDVGAGINPLPLLLAARGAAVSTLDGHAVVRNLAEREQWNEWGFFDYASLDSRIASFNSAYESWQAFQHFDLIYSVSVIEHLPAAVRRDWISRFAAQLEPGGLLLLTVDLVPDSHLLWNYAEGQVVESPERHGGIVALVQELQSAGFTLTECAIKRNIPRSRVDIALLAAQRG
jgi:2-polyprenyl-3-methyl-5-hydroxy-6-metoxy-1,4-benzoquinol methylase